MAFAGLGFADQLDGTTLEIVHMDEQKYKCRITKNTNTKLTNTNFKTNMNITDICNLDFGINLTKQPWKQFTWRSRGHLVHLGPREED